MTISVDYWDISIEDTINNIGAPTILEQCALNNTLCENIVRVRVEISGRAQYLTSTMSPLTWVKTWWSGVDLAFNWGVDGLGGTWTTNMIVPTC